MFTIGISREGRMAKGQETAWRDFTVCPLPTALLLHVASALFLPRLLAAFRLCGLTSNYAVLLCRLSLCPGSCYICHLFTRTLTADSFISHAPPSATRSLVLLRQLLPAGQFAHTTVPPGGWCAALQGGVLSLHQHSEASLRWKISPWKLYQAQWA